MQTADVHNVQNKQRLSMQRKLFRPFRDSRLQLACALQKVVEVVIDVVPSWHAVHHSSFDIIGVRLLVHIADCDGGKLDVVRDLFDFSWR